MVTNVLSPTLRQAPQDAGTLAATRRPRPNGKSHTALATRDAANRNRSAPFRIFCMPLSGCWVPGSIATYPKRPFPGVLHPQREAGLHPDLIFGHQRMIGRMVVVCDRDGSSLRVLPSARSRSSTSTRWDSCRRVSPPSLGRKSMKSGFRSLVEKADPRVPGEPHHKKRRPDGCAVHR